MRYQLKTQSEIDVLLKDYTQRPLQRAVIDEVACIGCTKCIKACPFDAIVGASKKMHTVITEACIGCELCIPPCPVDCIDMVADSNDTAQSAVTDSLDKAQKLEQAQASYLARLSRIQQAQQAQQAKHNRAKLVASRKATIQAAVERFKAKRERMRVGSQVHTTGNQKEGKT